MLVQGMRKPIMRLYEGLKTPEWSVSCEVERMQPREQVHEQHDMRGSSPVRVGVKDMWCCVGHDWVVMGRQVPVMYGQRAHKAEQSLAARGE